MIERLQGTKEGRTQEPAEDSIRQIDWDLLPDSVVAWVEIPDTNVDGPVAQGNEQSPDHYLYNDALGLGTYGTPYIDWECTPESGNVAVCGHYMDDGSQFADVAKCSDRDYAEEHQMIYWYIRADNARYELKVVAVDVLNASCETQHTGFKEDTDRITYLKEKLSASDLVLEEPNLETGQLVSFATCSYQTWNSRTVVSAQLDSG